MTTPLTHADLARLLAQAARITPARAAAILDAHPLTSLVKETAESLAALVNLSPQQAGGLQAGLTLGRLTCTAVEDAPLASTPRTLAAYLLPRYGHAPVEQFGIVALTTKHTIRGVRLISQGSIDASIVHPREVYRAAVELRAASLCVFHNHPSGDPTPSSEDFTVTTRLISAGTIIGIPLLDHLVLSTQRYYSFREAGRI